MGNRTIFATKEESREPYVWTAGLTLLGSRTDGKPVTMLPGALRSPDLTNLFLANLGLHVLRKTPQVAGRRMLGTQQEVFLFQSFSPFFCFLVSRSSIRMVNNVKDLQFPLQLPLKWFHSSPSLDTRIPMLSHGSVSRMKWAICSAAHCSTLSMLGERRKQAE